MTKVKPGIGIAGAGIAGLTAGIHYSRQAMMSGYSNPGCEQEAGSGVSAVNGIIVESGPEFIHGNLKETIGLLKKYQIPYGSVDGKMYQCKGRPAGSIL